MKKARLILTALLIISLLPHVMVVQTAAAPASGENKAIYVLPGYMGSRLYDSIGYEVWADMDVLTGDVFAYTAPGGNTSILLQDPDGMGSKVRAESILDIFGAQDEYRDLMWKLKWEFTGSNTYKGIKYDVVFFPYNWLGDVNESAQLLADDINSKGYDKVVLVTHSTGALVAATYIASSTANQMKVEKAILLAPPLFGTYVYK